MNPATRTVLFPALRGAFITAVLLLTYNLVTHNVEAGQAAVDNRTAAKLAQQAAYIKQLESTLATCLSAGDHPVRIGEEIWFCGASNTGIKMK